MKRYVMLWIASMVLVAMTTFAYAQAQLSPGSKALPQPQILSGSDIGFRIVGTDVNGNPIGDFVVRVNGNWVNPSRSGLRPLASY